MKNKIISITFLTIILGLFWGNLLTPDLELSYSERRRLAQLPEFSLESVLNAQYMNAFDKYSTDQFIGRESFRRLKTLVDRNIFFKRDTNGLFQVQGGIFSIEYPLHEDKVARLGQRLTALYDRYLTGMKVYYAIVPDKNYYLPDNGLYLLMDYPKLKELMKHNMPEAAQYIDLFEELSLDNYYLSDGHWRQETLKPVVDRLNQGMGNSQEFDPAQYESFSYYPFYGVYYGQLVGMANPDTLIWLENQITRDAQLTSLGHPGRDDLTVYYEDGLGGMDSYDVFLYGAQPLMVLDNPHNTSGRELILFRDSYGSSLAPLLLEGYSRITLVDLRYITQELLENYITFADQDILCIFSTSIINNSDIIR